MTNDNEPDDLPPSPTDEATRTRLDHDVYLKAVNNPTRRRMLELISKSPLAPGSLATQLIQEGLLQGENQLNYHLDMLVKAKCVELHRNTQGNIDTIKITQAGQVVDWMEK